MKKEFKNFKLSEILEAAKLTKKCDCAMVNGYILNELHRRQSPKSEAMPILTELSNSKFGCPSATFEMIEFGESSHEKCNHYFLLM
jgi:hypothetical protein